MEFTFEDAENINYVKNFTFELCKYVMWFLNLTYYCSIYSYNTATVWKKNTLGKCFEETALEWVNILAHKFMLCDTETIIAHWDYKPYYLWNPKFIDVFKNLAVGFSVLKLYLAFIRDRWLKWCIHVSVIRISAVFFPCFPQTIFGHIPVT
jgi:hypothetical protein